MSFYDMIKRLLNHDRPWPCAAGRVIFFALLRTCMPMCCKRQLVRWWLYLRLWLLCFPARRTSSVSPRLIMRVHRWWGYRNSFKVISAERERASARACARWFPSSLTYSLNCIIHIPPPSGNQSAHARIGIDRLRRLKSSLVSSRPNGEQRPSSWSLHLSFWFISMRFAGYAICRKIAVDMRAWCITLDVRRDNSKLLSNSTTAAKSQGSLREENWVNIAE